MNRDCTSPGCDRQSVRPEPYEALCSKHYLELVRVFAPRRKKMATTKKLYRIPHRWDYHQAGGYIVLASSAASAVKKAKAKHTGTAWRADQEPEWDKIEELGDDVYIESGCDC